MQNAIQLVTFEELKSYIVAHHKHSRLYGRNSSNGWNDDYGDCVIQGYLKAIHCSDRYCLISKFESRTGLAHRFGISNVVKYAMQGMTCLELDGYLSQCEVLLKNAVALGASRYILVNLRRRLFTIQTELDRRQG